MDWEPISEDGLWQAINRGYETMSSPQQHLWEMIRVTPQKWQQHPWGNQGGGFWVVAILGKTVIWYNDIEEGFNRSKYTDYGVIEDYWCNQDELNWVVKNVLNEII